jgi:uncharacterized protein YcfL
LRDAACRVPPRPEIAVSEQQPLVMESNVLGAVISAQSPEISSSDIQATASAKLFNERREPVTVHYRFYCDARGLEMHPLEALRSITVPPQGSLLYGLPTV